MTELYSVYKKRVHMCTLRQRSTVCAPNRLRHSVALDYTRLKQWELRPAWWWSKNGQVHCFSLPARWWVCHWEECSSSKWKAESGNQSKFGIAKRTKKCTVAVEWAGRGAAAQKLKKKVIVQILIKGKKKWWWLWALEENEELNGSIVSRKYGEIRDYSHNVDWQE